MSKQISQYGAQGELCFKRVDALPKDAKPVKSDHGRYIVGHSETGHHHVIDDASAEFFTSNDPFICYLRCEGVATVNHLRPHDTHEPLSLLGGKADAPSFWIVAHQREWTDEGERLAQD